jgi:SAM-dependent methyltransferase
VDRLLEATFQAETRHFWFRGLRRFVRPLLTEAVAGRARPRVLDAGCGTGCNLRMLAELAHAYGFDLNRVGLRYAREAGHTRVARASVVAIPFPDATFDVVTSFDVLYSLTEDHARRAMSEMARVLKPGGTLIVNVAALQILRGGHSVLAEELRRYDRRMMRDAVAEAGLRLTRLTYTNASLFPAILAARVLQRLAGMNTPEQTGHEISVPPAPINAVLDGVLSLEALILRVVDLPFGSSLLCAARKMEGYDTARSGSTSLRLPVR